MIRSYPLLSVAKIVLEKPCPCFQVVNGYNCIPRNLLMRQIGRVAAADCMGTDSDNGELLVAVLTDHEVPLLDIPLLLLKADVAGVEGCVKSAIHAFNEKEADLLATVGNFIEVRFAISHF